MRTYEVKKWTDLEWILIELLNEFIIQIPGQPRFYPDSHWSVPLSNFHTFIVVVDVGEKIMQSWIAWIPGFFKINALRNFENETPTNISATHAISKFHTSSLSNFFVLVDALQQTVYLSDSNDISFQNKSSEIKLNLYRGI